jgi:hypothetical protein
MPRRTSEHVTGDRGVAAVQKILADAGFASDVVHHDYGEDLLVQTSHAGQLDASRIWIQVKSGESLARHRRKDGSYSYSVPYEHAIRWVRSSDEVVVVLWDVSEEVGYFAKPSEQVDQWHWAGTGQASTTLKFDPEHVLDVEAVHRLAWESRMWHHYKLLLVAETRADEMAEEPEDEQDEESIALPMLLTLDFLSVVKVIERVDGGLVVAEQSRAVFQAEITKLLQEAGQSVDAAELKDLMTEAAIVTLLTQTGDVTNGLGLPTRVIAQSVTVLLIMLRMWDVLDEVAAAEGTVGS